MAGVTVKRKVCTHVYIVTKYSVNDIRANTNTCLCVNGRVSESACE